MEVNLDIFQNDSQSNTVHVVEGEHDRQNSKEVILGEPHQKLAAIPGGIACWPNALSAIVGAPQQSPTLNFDTLKVEAAARREFSIPHNFSGKILGINPPYKRDPG